MDIEDIDPQIRFVLLTAIAECITARPVNQVSFISKVIEKYSGLVPPVEPCRDYFHESERKCSRGFLEDLCEALETSSESVSDYIQVVVGAIQSIAPVSIGSHSPNKDDGILYKVRSGDSHLNLRVCDKNTPAEVLNLVQLIVHNINAL